MLIVFFLPVIISFLKSAYSSKNSISLEELESKKERIESSMNKNVIKMEYGKNKKEILMYVYSTSQVEFKLYLGKISI